MNHLAKGAWTVEDKIKRLMDKAVTIDPTITGWEWNRGHTFLFAQYSGAGESLGKIVGINTKKLEIIEL